MSYIPAKHFGAVDPKQLTLTQIRAFVVLSFLGLIVLIAAISQRFFKASERTQDSSIDQMTATSASAELSAEVSRNVSFIDSYITTQGHHSYKVIVLVDKRAVFTPIGVLVSGASVPVEPVTNLSCFRTAASQNVLDPYYFYLQGQSRAYISKVLNLEPAKDRDPLITLFVTTNTEQIFTVGGLGLKGYCNWLVD